jgi:hypothetical protein
LEQLNHAHEEINNHIDKAYYKLTVQVSDDLTFLFNELINNSSQIRMRAHAPKHNASTIRKQNEFLASLPSLWKQDQLLRMNSLLLETVLFTFSEKVRRILYDTSGGFKEAIGSANDNFFDRIEKLLQPKKISSESLNSFISDGTFSAGRVKVELKNHLDNMLRRIRLAENHFTEHMSLQPELNKNQMFSTTLSSSPNVDVYVRRLADFLVQQNLFSPLQQKIIDISEKVDGIALQIQDSLQRISIYLESNNTDNQRDGQWKNVVETEFQHLQKTREELQSYGIYLEKFVLERITTLEAVLSPGSFTDQIKSLQQYVKKEAQKRKWDGIYQMLTKSKNSIRHTVSQIWFRQSKGLLLTERLRKSENHTQTRVNDVLALRSKMLANNHILGEVPFYYQQLFTQRQYHLNDFFVGRQRELQQFKLALENYQKGFHGGIMVAGERTSGKSFFCHYAAKTALKTSQSYVIHAPFSGAISTSIFKTQLQKATDIYGSYDEIFSALPPLSVIIIEDMELWWEKSANGMRVIEQILFLMERYSSKVLFLINANIHSFWVINALRKIESYFLNIIELEPLDAGEIQEAVMRRHKSSNLQFELENHSRPVINSIRQARLFNQYFNYSKGNIGVALNSWLINIKGIENDQIVIGFPEIPNDDSLHPLETEWLLLLVQFFIHKRLTHQKLLRITMDTHQMVFRKLNILKRSGLIYEDSDGVFEIDRYLYPIIRKKLKEKQLL